MSPGRESKEAAAQAEREQQVLAFLFLSREMYVLLVTVGSHCHLCCHFL